MMMMMMMTSSSNVTLHIETGDEPFNGTRTGNFK